LKDLTIYLDDRPGTLAKMGEALGAAGVNIEGICGFPSEGKGQIHILIDNVAAAREALQNANIEIGRERDILIWDIGSSNVDKPGLLGEFSRRLSDAGVNIDLLYIASNNRAVLGVDNLEKARELM
jgi:hypothetical protein